MNLGKIKIGIKINLKSFSFFMEKMGGIIFLIIALIFIGYFIRIWYKFVQNPKWSEVRRQEYIDNLQNKQVVFDRNKFESVFSRLESRRIDFEKTPDPADDIFKIKN